MLNAEEGGGEGVRERTIVCADTERTKQTHNGTTLKVAQMRSISSEREQISERNPHTYTFFRARTQYSSRLSMIRYGYIQTDKREILAR